MRITDTVEIFSEPTARHLKLAIVAASTQAHQRGEEIREIQFSTMDGARPSYCALLIIGKPADAEDET